MKLSVVATIFRKELKDTLRDRRTIISMIVVPTLIIPLLVAVVGTISSRVVKQARQELPAVAVIGGTDAPELMTALSQHAKLRTLPAPSDWRERIARKELRAALEIPADFQATLDSGRSQSIRIYHYEGELRSGLALSELRSFLSNYRENRVTEALAARDLPATLIRPFEIRAQNVAPPEKVGGNAIGGIIPYVFILLCFTGAMYPGMDLTAGEKERGTLETLLSSPAGRLEIVLGKFLLVLTASLITVVFALLSMIVSATIGGLIFAASASDVLATAKTAAASSGVPLPRIDPVGLIGVGALVFPLAVLFASVILTLGLFARTMKEAQSYISPLIVVILLPAMVGLLPGVELNSRLALVPVLNVSLASKELLSGTWPWTQLALIFGSSCAYATAGFLLCVRMFNRESVLFSRA